MKMLQVDPERLKATKTGFHVKALFQGKIAKCDISQLTRESFIDWFTESGKPVHFLFCVMMIMLGHKTTNLHEVEEIRRMRIDDEELKCVGDEATSSDS